MPVRGQLSIEYLLLFLVALVLLGISISAMLSLQELSEAYAAKVSFSKSAHRLLLRMEEVCVLGKGNSREVLLSAPVRVSTTHNRGDTVTIEEVDGNATVSRELMCAVEGGEFSGRVVVALNDEGEITIEEVS